jgi:hypothetical protein
MNADPFPTAFAEGSSHLAPSVPTGIALSAAPFPPGLTLNAFRGARQRASVDPAAAGDVGRAPRAYVLFTAILAVATMLLVVFAPR